MVVYHWQLQGEIEIKYEVELKNLNFTKNIIFMFVN